MRWDSCAATNGLVRGSMDEIRGDTLYGWIFSPFSPVKPTVFVDDAPGILVGEKLPRPDVGEALGISEDTGFAFRLPSVRESSLISLYGVTPNGVFLAERKKAGIPVCERLLSAQLEQAAAVARRPGAVAVVCWDGAHNPIGRAKVLYDIAARKRPVVLFCYLHKEFGGTIWYPLINSETVLVAIPWEERRECRGLLRRYGLAFDTVWIGKNRLPSFMLAAAVSHRDTRFILDMDDDEEAFMDLGRGRTAYNAPGRGLARELTAGIASRTVVSPTLRERFGGLLVRHARQPLARRKAPDAGVCKLAFIGTVRPHKNVLAIAKAVNLIRFTTHLRLELHVYGDIQPPEYRDALAAHGVVLRDLLPARHVPALLADMHVVVTGFPHPETDATAKAIAAAQVSAKISDALALGLPVLTPDTPAVADLRDLPGVYPFTVETFEKQLLAALKHREAVALPPDFTLDGAYASFEEAESRARPAPALHRLLPGGGMIEQACGERPAGEKAAPALVLLWKQHDAGIYGRRVDQIARSYKRRYPDHRVFVLETYCTRVTDEREEDFTDEAALKADLLKKKRHGLECGGVLLKTFCYDEESELRAEFSSFLVRQDLRPETSLFVLFPVMQDLRLIEDLLRPYRKVIDVVDNQLSWATSEERRCFVLEQYFRLLAPASHVIFNAENTRDFFAAEHFLDTVGEVRVLPNWYTPPEGVALCRHPLTGKMKHLFYSGNMNDRLDWELLRTLALLPDIRLHLAGTAARVAEPLERLLACESVIYHGVTTERETLALLQSMDACLLPHLLDDVSFYMNPIKVRMYQAAGVPILCPDFLSLSGGKILFYGDAKECVKKIMSLRKEKTTTRQAEAEEMRAYQEATEGAYMRLLGSLRGE